MAENILTPTLALDRAEIISRLAAFREEWEGEGVPLIELEVSLGLMLVDLVEMLGLSDEEKRQVLGPHLANVID